MVKLNQLNEEFIYCQLFEYSKYWYILSFDHRSLSDDHLITNYLAVSEILIEILFMSHLLYLKAKDNKIAQVL